MKRILILILPFLVSCGAQKKALESVPPVSTETTETKVTIKEVFRRDTVYVEIPAQQAERTTRDSTSRLETDFAASVARINQDGTLYHDLKNKPQKKPVPLDTKVIIKDSLVYVDKTVPVPYPVERKLTAWERVSIKYFKWIVPLLLLLVGYIFKKPILTLIRRFI